MITPLMSPWVTSANVSDEKNEEYTFISFQLFVSYSYDECYYHCWNHKDCSQSISKQLGKIHNEE